jgi:putative SOS response-associated peptidase YedK
MSRLHCILAGLPEIASHFGVSPVPEFEFFREMREGGNGMVVREGRGGRPLLQPMSWGFPRLTKEMREKGELPDRLGLVADLTNPIWSGTVVEQRYRCIIPLTHFANPDGDPGEKTRTWFSVEGQRIMAWAGFCRNTEERGPVYAGMTMDANAAVAPTNDRMPVLLEPDEYDRWLHGSIEDLIYFQYRPPVAAERMAVLPTKDLWQSGKLPVQRHFNMF